MNHTTNTPVTEADVKQKLRQLYVDYKLAITAEYFTKNIGDTSTKQGDQDPSHTAWRGPSGIIALPSPTNPVLAKLATPKLAPDLQLYLDRGSSK